jgi:hypothetical protein
MTPFVGRDLYRIFEGLGASFRRENTAGLFIQPAG